MLGHYLFKNIRQWSSPTIRSHLYRTKSKETADRDGKKILETPKDIIAPGSAQHNDLQSFLKYASRQNLSSTNATYIGTLYEYTVASALRRLGFTLTRTGRTADLGIDLIGHWKVPSLPAPVRVIVQCKGHNKSLGPAYARELEGAFVGAPARWASEGTFGFLAAPMKATRGMRDALIRSRLPMGFLQVTNEGKILQLVWNHEATQRGLEGLGVTARFKPAKEGGRLEEEIALTWKGLSLSSTQEQEATTVLEQKSQTAEVLSNATGDTVVKKRGRPRKIEEPELKKRGRPRKELEMNGKTKTTLAKAKVPKDTKSKVKVTKSRNDSKLLSRGQKKKG
jgi:hypothetical protein